MAPARTIGEQLQATSGRPAGFDYLRIGLAALVVVWHTAVTCYGKEAQASLSLGSTRPFWALIMPMFFALSGFLVTGSLERSKTLLSFVGLRVIRLVPALLVDTLLAACLLGPIFTALPFEAYFTHSGFWSYFLNVVGDVHFTLPGVFVQNPRPEIVNGQLWTLPWEMRCYLLITLLVSIGAYRMGKLLVLACVVLQCALAFRGLTHLTADDGIVDGSVLTGCFLLGVLLYRYRHKVRLRLWMFIFSVVASVVCLSSDRAAYLVPLPVSYMTIYLGMTNPRRSPLLSSGDYSYGIFLYGYAIQQAIAVNPLLRHWYFSLPLAGALTGLVAVASWHCVEKPALKLRPLLYKLELRWLPVANGIHDYCASVMPHSLRSRWVRKVG